MTRDDVSNLVEAKTVSGWPGWYSGGLVSHGSTVGSKKYWNSYTVQRSPYINVD